MIPSSLNTMMLGVEESGAVENSGSFVASESDHMLKVSPATADRQTWTFSTWVKQASIGFNRRFIGSGTDGNNNSFVRFTSANQLAFGNIVAATVRDALISTATYTSITEWYHVVIAYDSTQAVEADRIRMYVDEVEVTSFSSTDYPTLNSTDGFFGGGSGFTYAIGAGNTIVQFFDGLQAEVYMIYGQQLTPSSFSSGGSPIPFTGSFGANDFYFNFSNASDLGEDASGNGNDYTNNGVTQSVDVPT